MKNMKKLTLIIIIAVVFCLSSVAAYAYFAVTAEGSADAKTGLVQVQLNEDFPQTDEYGAPIDTVKTFFGANTGNKMAYARAQIFAAPEYRYSGTGPSGSTVDEWRPLAVPVSDFPLTITSPDWIDGGDGYLYYSKILNPGDDTTNVTVEVQTPNSSKLPDNTDIRLNVRVVLESAQVTNGAYKTVFGIADLPGGVEVLE